jgi:Zn-dependent protease
VLAVAGFVYSRSADFVFAFLGLLTIVFVHELGHALSARRMRFRVVAIDIHGFGGECWLEGAPTGWRLILFAWSGVLAQAVLLLVPDALILAGIHPSSPAGLAYMATFIGPNMLLMLINLIPTGGLDGATAWKILPLLLRRLKMRVP